MPENPYYPPTAPVDGTDDEVDRAGGTHVGCLPIVVGAILGGFLGILSYVLAAMLLELYVVPRFVTPDAPRLSYGQQAVVIMTPLAGIYGVGIGVGLAFWLSRKQQWAASVFLLATVFISAIVGMLWQSSVAQYGRDISELVLFAPYLLAAAPITIFALACLLRPAYTKQR